MPKNNKKKKKPSQHNKQRELVYKDVDQHYASITNKFGDGRYEIMVTDTGETKRGRIKGSIRKRTRVEIGQYVLASIRDFDDKVMDIIHVYKPEESDNLKRYGEIVLQQAQKTQEDEIVFEDI